MAVEIDKRYRRGSYPNTGYTRVIYSNDRFISSESRSSCSSSQTWKTYQPTKEVRVKRNSERRVKPSPLTVTSQSHAYKSTSLQGVYSKVTTTTQTCNGKIVPKIVITRASSWLNGIEDDVVDLNQLQSKLNWILRSKIQKLRPNVSSSIAEIDKSISLYIDCVGSVFSIVSCYASPGCLASYFSKHAATLYDLAHIWLTINFDLVPNIEALAESLDKLQSQTNEPMFRFMNHTVSGFANRVPVGTNALKTQVTKLRANLLLKMKVDNKPIDWGNPIEWLWERIPFSFVVDWLIPIGPWLNILDATQTIDAISGTITKRTVETCGADFARMLPVGYSFDVEPQYHCESHTRSIANSIGIPQFPGFRPTDQWNPLLDAIALLYVVRKDRVSRMEQDLANALLYANIHGGINAWEQRYRCKNTTRRFRKCYF